MFIILPSVFVFYAFAFIASLIYSLATAERTRHVAGLFTMASLFIAWLFQGVLLSLAFASAPNSWHGDAFQLVSWVIALSFMILSVSTRMLKTGWIFTGAILLFMGLSLVDGAAAPLAIVGTLRERVWGELHLLSSFLGVAVLTVQAIIAVLYLIKGNSLKRKSWSRIESIPPLDRLYSFSSKLLWIGFLLLTAGLLSGGGWSKILYGVYLTNDFKEALTLITWFLYAIAVNLRAITSWRGRRVVTLSLIAFLGLLLSLGVSHRS